MPRRKHSAVMRHFLDVPAVADSELEAPRGHLVNRGHQLRGLDRITLGDQADAGTKLQPLRHRGRRGQHHERVHDVVIGLWQIAAAWERRRP